MKHHTRTIAAAASLALVAAAAVAWVVLSGGNSDGTAARTTAVTVPDSGQVSPPEEQSAGPSRGATSKRASGKAAGHPQLKLLHRGQPIVWLRRHETLPIRRTPGGEVVKKLRWRTQFGSRTVLSVFRRRGPWAGVPTPLLPEGQLGWVKLDPSRLRAGWTRYAIDIDLSAKAAQLRLGNRVLRSFKVTIGAHSSPTPTGRFAITDTFRAHLNPAYGCCALATTAIQPNLPSGWLGGNRIAIHGTTGSLGLAESHGCVRASNPDVSALVKRVGLGAPVLIHQ
jgi:L,D-transpeptidase catalytic domain